MNYIEVINLEKYHPGYADRNLIWCKVYFSILNADPEFELLCEIDKWRFIAFIILQLQTKKSIPLDKTYLERKGFNYKTRHISLTLQMLHNFIRVREENNENVTQSRVEEIRKDEEDKSKNNVTSFWDYFLLKTKKAFKLTDDNRDLIKKRLNEGYTLEQLKKAVDAFMADDWPGRSSNLDLIYCIGKQKGKADSLEKWLNKEPPCKKCRGTGKFVNERGYTGTCDCSAGKRLEKEQ